MRTKLRDPTFSDKLNGTVEGDETWIGGKKRGKGRGYRGNKMAVVGLVERGGRVRSRSIKHVTSKNLRSVLSEHVDGNATLMTDELPAYRGPGRAFRAHETVNHRSGEYARGHVHTNTIEGYFALLKRGINGVYHHVGTQHLDQYLGEFDFRYCTRALTDGQRTIAGLQKAEGKRLMLRGAYSG